MELEKRYRELTDLLVMQMPHNLSFYSIFTTILDLCCGFLCMYLFLIQYYKQTQLEAMASEKAAAEFQLEKEVKRLQEAQVCHYLLTSG